MAADFLETLLRANLAAALAIALVLCLRKPVRAAFGAGAAYALWAMAPVAALASLLPPRTAMPLPDQGSASVSIFFLEALPSQSIDLAPFVMGIWIVGVLAGLTTLAIRQARLARAMGRLSAEPNDARLVCAARADIGPAVVGVLSPKIVLPSDFQTRYSADEQAVILAHETAHLKAGDTRINASIALLRCIAWFNPLVHIGATYARLDQELARDAGVAMHFPSARRCYAQALLKSQLAALELGCGWTPRTGEILKGRIAMLAIPAPTRLRRTMGGALAACAAALVGTAAWAAQPSQPAEQSGQPGQQLAQAESQDVTLWPPQDGQPGAQAEGETLQPLFRRPPVYPPDALARNASGMCTMSFDLAADGDPFNVSAECTDPVFATPAIEALDQWRYASLADDASGLPRTGVMMQIEFLLADN